MNTNPLQPHLQEVKATWAPAVLVVFVLVSWMFDSGLSTDENPLQIVAAGLFVLVLPGLLFGQMIGVKISSPIESIALSFFGSLVVGLLLALIMVGFGASIVFWTWGLIIWNVLWLGVIIYNKKIAVGGFLDAFAASHSTARRKGDLVFLLIMIALSIALYRWADRLSTVYWEVGVHLSYVQYYVSGAPLTLHDLGLRTELPMPNLFFIWELSLAGISYLSHQDPLIAAMRSRWLVPLLGFTSFFVFVRHVLNNVEIARYVTWGALILSLTQVMFLDPNPLVAAKIVTEQTRPLFSFLGSIHHSDVAMEVLLPIITGFLFFYIYSGRKEVLGLVIVSLFVAFFFHPREFFQLMWYGFLWAVVVVITVRSFMRDIYLTRGVFLAGAFILVAGVCGVITTQLGSGAGEWAVAEGDVEFAKKSVFMKEFLASGWRPPYFENPLNFQMHMPGSGAPVAPPMVFSFLVLSTLMIVVLAVYGSPHEQRVTLFFAILWLASTTVIPIEKILEILTYSEILVTKMRFLPIFAMIIIMIGWLRLIEVSAGWAQAANRNPWVVTLGGTVVFGMAFAGFWHLDAPSFTVIRYAFPVILVMGVGLLNLSIWDQRLKQKFVFLRAIPFPVRRFNAENGRLDNGRMALISLTIFSVIVGHVEFGRLVTALVNVSTDVEALASDGNEMGLPAETLEFVRKEIPVRARFQVRPSSIYMIGAVAPVQVVPIPRGQIHADAEERRLEREGRHPLFNDSVKNGEGGVTEIVNHLNKSGAEYVLIGPEYYSGYRTLLKSFPDVFEVVHNVPNEALVLMVKVLH